MGGRQAVMTPIRNMFPSLGAYETEHSGFVTNPDQASLDFPEHHSEHEKLGPGFREMESFGGRESRSAHWRLQYLFAHRAGETALTGNISYSIEYYTLGHFSKYVLPGANRVIPVTHRES